jgi:hypothetical protein
VNINPILAILVLKNIITTEEAEKVAEFVHDKPQSTILSDVINQIKELVPMNTQPLTGGPEQQAEELAARQRVADEEAAKAKEAKAAEDEDRDDEETDKAEEKAVDNSGGKSSKK